MNMLPAGGDAAPPPGPAAGRAVATAAAAKGGVHSHPPGGLLQAAAASTGGEIRRPLALQVAPAAKEGMCRLPPCLLHPSLQQLAAMGGTSFLNPGCLLLAAAMAMGCIHRPRCLSMAAHRLHHRRPLSRSLPRLRVVRQCSPLSRSPPRLRVVRHCSPRSRSPPRLRAVWLWRLHCSPSRRSRPPLSVLLLQKASHCHHRPQDCSPFRRGLPQQAATPLRLMNLSQFPRGLLLQAAASRHCLPQDRSPCRWAPPLQAMSTPLCHPPLWCHPRE